MRDYNKTAELIRADRFRIQLEKDEIQRMLRDSEIAYLGEKGRGDLLQTRVETLEKAIKTLVDTL